MARAAPADPLPLDYAPPPPAVPDTRVLGRQLVWLALPILVENVLHMFVGLTDTYLAGHLPTGAKAATAAVGAVTYVLWLIGLVAGAIGTGSTAIIARAVGARHRSLANGVCGQTVGAAGLVGLGMAAGAVLLAVPLVKLTGLQGDAYAYCLLYFRILTLSLPFAMVMYAASACLRGAGDSVSPAAAWIAVDVVNMLVSASLTRGWWGLPVLGLRGIAIGTTAAYVVGGLILFAVLWTGWGKVRLFAHRLRPHWLTLKRILRIGLPSGLEGMLTWIAQFGILVVINRIDLTNVMASAHIVTIRVESLSFMAGLAFATAAATMVGQSLGMKDPARAKRSAYLAFAIGTAVMAAWGLTFVLAGRPLARALTADPAVAALAGRCLRVTGCAQIGFAASMIFGGALRGAGDTMVVMAINLASTIGLRLTGVLLVTLWLGYGLEAIWMVLATELSIRGFLVYLRFLQGGWRHVKV